MKENLEGIRFIASVGNGKTTACLMSARALLDGRPFSDKHPSAVLRVIGIRINDGSWWSDDEERTRMLMPLALDERLCASNCNASRETEQARATLCVEWALSWAVPFALEQAALALEARRPEHAKTLREHAAKLRAEPTRENALAARGAARAAAADAAYAAYAADAADADAAYAAAAAADAAAAYAAAYALKAKKIVRDSLIDLFKRLLGVCNLTA